MAATALHEKFSAAGARLTEYCGAQTAAVFSRPEAEFAALRSACGLLDLAWRAKILVTGKDRQRWLNGMVSNNVRDLAPGCGAYSFLLNVQGHILADMYVYNRGEYFVLDTDRFQAEKLMPVLKRYIIMDQVELTDASDKLGALGLQGPKAGEVLGAAAIQPAQLQPLEVEDRVWREIGISLLPTLHGGYEVWLAPENAPKLWEALSGAGATPAGTEALELWRVASGIPRYGQDIRERDLPQETGQQQALNFTKGCYIGQEIVERIRSRGAVHRKFTGFTFAGPPPPPGTKIRVDGREVGEITSVAQVPTPTGEKAIGLGYIRREPGPAGATVEAGGVPATITELPFDLQ